MAPKLAALAAFATSVALAAALLVPTTGAAAAGSSATINPLLTPDSSGIVGTFSTSGKVIDPTNPFFQSLGTNGRSCVSCHVPTDGWSLTPPEVQLRFALTGGTDPLFRTVDGANSPNADVSTLQARRAAYSMLLNKGVIRVGIGIPSGAEFSLVAVDDPYGFASASQLSLFRRPLPSANLGFLSAVMWDGRESSTLTPGTAPVTDSASLATDLAHQALDATLGHAQAATAPTAAQQQAIVNFELALLTAQSFDTSAGPLAAAGAQGGPLPLASQPFSIGINDLVVQPTTTPPTVVPPNQAMTLFNAWAGSSHTPAQQAVARGETIFNSKPIMISGVAGLNDALGLATFQGTCATCHNDPNVGNHSTAVPLNLGLTDASRRTPDLPLYTLRNNATGETIQTTDPGRALITGKWADIGKFKGPTLRGLAARAPYFHNGSAATLDAVVDFYNTRFGIGLSAQDHADLVAFLRSL